MSWILRKSGIFCKKCLREQKGSIQTNFHGKSGIKGYEFLITLFRKFSGPWKSGGLLCPECNWKSPAQDSFSDDAPINISLANLPQTRGSRGNHQGVQIRREMACKRDSIDLIPNVIHILLVFNTNVHIWLRFYSDSISWLTLLVSAMQPLAILAKLTHSTPGSATTGRQLSARHLLRNWGVHFKKSCYPMYFNSFSTILKIGLHVYFKQWLDPSNTCHLWTVWGTSGSLLPCGSKSAKDVVEFFVHVFQWDWGLGIRNIHFMKFYLRWNIPATRQNVMSRWGRRGSLPRKFWICP
jgi:hypothetical protein